MTTGAAFAREDDAFRIVLAHHGQRARAFELGDGRAHGLEQILHRFEVVMDAVSDDLGVRLRREFVAETLQLFTQLIVVLDDAVVNDRETVVRDVGMRVALARHTVRGPASVGDADVAVRGALVNRLLQHLDLADGAHALELLRAVEHRDARRVVTSILEPAQTLHEDGHDVALSDSTDDSAHGSQGPGVL